MCHALAYSMARSRAMTRPSHRSWNGGSFGSASTLPKLSMPPMSRMPSISSPSRLLRQASSDHRIAGDKFGEPLLAPAVCSGRPHRKHKESGFGCRIPDTDFSVPRKPDAEILKHPAWVLNRTRAIRGRLVPDRRKAEHLPRITGAKRAHDDVVCLGRILDRDQMIPDPTDVAQCRDGVRRISKQSPLECRVAPGLGYDGGTVAWPDPRFVSLDNGVQGGRIDIAFLGEHGFQCANAQLHFRKLGMVVVVVMIAVVIVPGHSPL